MVEAQIPLICTATLAPYAAMTYGAHTSQAELGPRGEISRNVRRLRSEKSASDALPRRKPERNLGHGAP
jgi:hypothetical protein